MKLNTRLILLFFVALSFSSCKQENAVPNYKFSLTTEPQRVLFKTEKGWTGGGGDPVYVPGHGYRAQFNGLPILLLGPAQNLIDEKLAPPEKKGMRTILVEARVHLEEDSVKMGGNPPSRRSVYSVVIDKLLRAEWR